MGDLKGKVAVVTGSSRGIGRGIAENLSRRGAHVVINYNNDKKAAEEVLERITQRGGKAIAVKADTSKIPEIKRLFEETLQAFGGLDIFVANAGIYQANPLIAVTEEEYDRLFLVNTKGVFFGLQEAAKIVREDGRIIFIGTAMTQVHNNGFNSVYAATKAASEQFAKALAAELAAKRVTVNTVSPGYTETDILPKEYYEMGAKASVFGRLGNVEEVAEVVGFLASPAARWVTGGNLQVSGGAVMPQ